MPLTGIREVIHKHTGVLNAHSSGTGASYRRNYASEIYEIGRTVALEFRVTCTLVDEPCIKGTCNVRIYKSGSAR